MTTSNIDHSYHAVKALPNLLSSGAMDAKHRPPLGQYLHDQRHARGLTMAEAAARADTSAAYWSQIEGGQVKLPGADLRRRIAGALGIRHVDILIAAGELTAEEAGREDAPDDAVERVIAELRPLMAEVAWTPGRVNLLRVALEHYRDDDRRWAETDRPSTAAPGQPAPIPPPSRQ